MKKIKTLLVRKLIVICLLAPFMAFSQGKNLMNVSKVFPKMDKMAEFEKALTSHSQKYHTGEAKWRVYQIMSGPDAGGYMIAEGPSDFAGMDSRGDLGAEHTADYAKNVAIHMTDKYSSDYLMFQDTLSTVGLGNFSDKITISHWYPKFGQNAKVFDGILALKKGWKQGGLTVAVYRTVNSGNARFSMVYRLKNGFKDLATGGPSAAKRRYEAANGEDSYDNYVGLLQEHTANYWSEMLTLRPDLGSK
ncbi:MAG: hypothetical protein V4683_01955 [Bacteroidota bacterium]